MDGVANELPGGDLRTIIKIIIVIIIITIVIIIIIGITYKGNGSEEDDDSSSVVQPEHVVVNAYFSPVYISKCFLHFTFSCTFMCFHVLFLH